MKRRRRDEWTIGPRVAISLPGSAPSATTTFVISWIRATQENRENENISRAAVILSWGMLVASLRGIL